MIFSLAHELGPRTIRVNSILPGPTNTPAIAGNFGGELPVKARTAHSARPRHRRSRAQGMWTAARINDASLALLMQQCTMMTFFHFAVLVTVFLPSALTAATYPKEPATLSPQQVERILAAFSAGTAAESALSALPDLQGSAITHLVVQTGIHPVEPNAGEDYFVFEALVKNRRHVFRFTVTPKVDRSAPSPGLHTILRNGRVTQYAVEMAAAKPHAMPVTLICRSREPRWDCEPPGPTSVKNQTPSSP